MNNFQILGVSLAGGFVLVLLAALARRKISRRAGSAWLALWAAAGFFIARPQTTFLFARAMGIERGADLVFYFAILAAGVGFFAVFVKLRRIDDSLTRIARHIALAEAEEPPAAAAGEPPEAAR